VTPLERAWNAFHSEDFEAAENLFRQCNATTEEAREARSGLVYVYARTGRFEEARDSSESLRLEGIALGDAGLEYAALHQLGIVERLAGQWKRALEVFADERAVIVRLGQPPLPLCANAFETGILHGKLGDVDAARDWLRVALEAAGLAGDAGAEGSCLRALGELAANATMRRALFTQSAMAFERAGDEDSALEVRMLADARTD
jgi:tetratricopeptide (TPR) repeat protein